MVAKSRKINRERRIEITRAIEYELATHCRRCVNVGNDAVNCGGCVTLSDLRALGVQLGGSDLKPIVDLTVEQRRIAAANGIREKTAIMRIKRGMSADEAVTKALVNNPWTPEEDKILSAMKKEKLTLNEIAKALGRSAGSAKTRWERLKREEG